MPQMLSGQGQELTVVAELTGPADARLKGPSKGDGDDRGDGVAQVQSVDGLRQGKRWSIKRTYFGSRVV